MHVFTTAPETARVHSHGRTTSLTSSGLPSLIVAGLLWGTGGLTGRLLANTTHLGALAVAAYRLTIGGTLIVAFLLVAGRKRPRGKAAWTRIVQIAVLAAAFQGCYFSAVALTDVSLATLFTIGASPVMVLAFEQATGRRRATRKNVSAVCLALTDLVLLVGFPQGAFTTTDVLASVGMATLSAAGFAAVTLVSTKPVSGLDELTTTGYAFALGGLALAAISTTTSTMTFHSGPKSLALLLVLGTAPTAVAYTLYFRGLKTVAASTATVIALLEPLTGALLAATFLGDRLGLTGLAGASLLAVAVLLTSTSRTPTPDR